MDSHKRFITSYVYRKAFRVIFFAATLILFSCLPLYAGKYYLLQDYYSLIYGKYYQFYYPLISYKPLSSSKPDTDSSDINEAEKVDIFGEEEELQAEFNLEGEINLDLIYGGAFSLREGVVVGAGTEGITDGLRYDLIERIILEGKVGERLFLEFNYDSERSERGIGEEKNIYSVMYKGKKGEFLKEATLGNKYLSMEDSRYIPIDEGNQDSFALRAKAGWDRLYMEGLFRYNVALDGRKQFKGFRKSVDMKVLDLDYVKGRFFFIPDTNIDEGSLLLYKTSVGGYDILVDDKKFTLLRRGVDYDYDNTNGNIYLEEALFLDDELIIYYEKGGISVGDTLLGANAIIDSDGVDPDGGRVDFNSSDFPDYFDSTKLYLYLKKRAFNSYWELKNIYYLEEIAGQSISNLTIELLYTAGGGINSNYDELLGNYDIDTGRGIIKFNFSDEDFNPGGGFYPRPFPGGQPFTATYTPPNPTKPFDGDNPIYGGINYPTSDKSINTLKIQYNYYAESLFLDFELVPESVTVIVNGNTLDPKYYDIDYTFGIITFKEGIINPSSDIDITYKYTPFGGGDKDIFTALGITYEGDILRARNLLAYQTALKGNEAPEIGSEGKSVLKNSTKLSLNLGAEEGEEGAYAALNSEVAFSVTNKNVHGSAVIADMEREEYIFAIDLQDSDWMIASKSMDLPDNPYMSSRGNVYYKNYWTESFFYGDILQSISWDIPGSQVFDYSEKAGPYNSADKPQGGEDVSLVIDYEFGTNSTNPYVTVVTPLATENLTDYERFNMLMKADITGDDVHVYVEVLKNYNEDIDGDGTLDGEGSINDYGFEITPEDGSSTVIGTDKKGKSNGKIDSEDLNGSGYLDYGSEEGVEIPQSGLNNYIVSIAEGSHDWQYISVDILGLMNSNKAIFQYANALRITVTANNSSPAYTASGSGKIVINKLWFSGSAMVNNSSREGEDYLTISEVSVYEDPAVAGNRFSNTYPGIYNDLHGDISYRTRLEYEERVLKCFLNLSASNPLQDGEIASISRRFGTPANMISYREFLMFLYLPSSQTIPSSLNFVLSFLSSTNEKMEITIPGDNIQNGWNKITVMLDSPYLVQVNDSDIGNMVQTGDLYILKRVSEIRFGFKAEGADITSPLEIWLDEWYVQQSKEYSDKAFFAEGTVGYNGSLVTLFDFSFITDPALSLGYERKEGNYYEDIDYKSDRYFGEIESSLFQYLGTGFSLSKEYITPLRNIEQLGAPLNTDDYRDNISHRAELNLKNRYLPVLQHSYDRTVMHTRDIQLTDTSYRYESDEEYSESLGFGEYIDFPFGLYHSYSLTRNWLYRDSSFGYPETGFTLSKRQEADINQVSDILLSFNWQEGSTSMRFKRDQAYTGSFALFSEDYLNSYTLKLSALFYPPSELLENANLSLKTDSLMYDISIPLREELGFSGALNTNFNESNFYVQNSYRDTLAKSSINLSFPFHPFNNDKIEVRPSMERELKMDYKKVIFSASEEYILLYNYKYLFMPPFYYIHPIEGLGRIRDYYAVDIYKGSDEVLGNTANILSNRYSLETFLQYDPWYIPSSITIAFGGEAKREGESYTQKRNGEFSLSKYFLLGEAEGYFDKSLNVTLDYKNEIDYATKVISNTFGVSNELHILKSSFSGIKVNHTASYERERQSIGDAKLYLFPGHPEREVPVSFFPYKDTISNEVFFQYLWELDIRKTFLSFLFGSLDVLLGTIKNEEGVKLENIYTFTDRERAESFSNIPIRLTLEHDSSYHVTENFSFGLNLKSMVGIEEKVIPPSIQGNILPSMGFEIGIKMKIIF